MFLMTNRDMLAGLELSLIPILGTVWYAVQINLIDGFCFYTANFKYSKYDATTVIDMCEKAAADQMLAVSKQAADQLACPKTYCNSAEIEAIKAENEAAEKAASS